MILSWTQFAKGFMSVFKYKVVLKINCNNDLMFYVLNQKL